MKRFFLVLTVAALLAVMVAANVAPAFAAVNCRTVEGSLVCAGGEGSGGNGGGGGGGTRTDGSDLSGGRGSGGGGSGTGFGTHCTPYPTDCTFPN